MVFLLAPPPMERRHPLLRHILGAVQCRRGEQRSGSNLAVTSPRTEERNRRHIASLPMLYQGLACPVVPCSAGLLLFAT